jgi:diamine N-acetyltransferase
MYDHKNGCSFRKLRRDDLTSLLELKDAAWVSQHTTAFLNDEDQEEWFNNIPSTSLYMICEHKMEIDSRSCGVASNSTLVGLLSLTNINHINRTASIAGAIFSSKRNTDWVKKAWQAGTDFGFEMLNLHRLEGEVLETNVASLALELAVGYTIEGKRRLAVYKSGRYLDSYTFGMLQGDWRASLFNRFGDYTATCNTNFKQHRSASKILERAGVKLEVKMPDSGVEVQKVATNMDAIIDKYHIDGDDSLADQHFDQAVS